MPEAGRSLVTAATGAAIARHESSDPSQSGRDYFRMSYAIAGPPTIPR
jgi:hypothetical protein